jgi:predicted nucleic acid-binding Zn ribbon protein
MPSPWAQWKWNVTNMKQKITKTILMTTVLCLALLILDKWGLFKTPIFGAVVVVLLILGFPITWYIKEYLKKKYPQLNLSTKCPVCGFEIPDDKIHCDNCGTALEGELAGEDEFSEDVKVKKICPYCGLKELATVYEIGRGYKEVCANCGNSYGLCSNDYGII